MNLSLTGLYGRSVVVVAVLAGKWGKPVNKKKANKNPVKQAQILKTSKR